MMKYFRRLFRRKYSAGGGGGLDQIDCYLFLLVFNIKEW